MTASVNIKRIVSLLVLTGWYSYSFAQAARIQKAQAFFTVSIPGMQMADAQGNRINPEPIIERFIYIECKSNNRPMVDSVWYNGILFIAAVADQEEKSNTIGIKKDNGSPVSLHTKKGNHTWKIQLVQAEGKTLQHASVKKILIRGKIDKTKFTYTISTETELATPDRP